MKIKLATKPESNPQLLGRSLQLYGASFLHVIGFALLFSVIAFIPRWLSLILGQKIFLFTNFFSFGNLWLLLVNIGGVFVFLAIIWRLHCMLIHTHETVTDDMKVAAKKLLLIIIAAVIQTCVFMFISIVAIILYYLIISGKLLYLPDYIGPLLMVCVSFFHVIATIFVFVLFFFYMVLILTEDKGIISGFMKSTFLVWNNWWRVFSLQVVAPLIYFICLLIIKFILKIDIHIYLIAPAAQDSWLITLFHMLLFTLFVPWLAATLLVQLRDLELRKHV